MTVVVSPRREHVAERAPMREVARFVVLSFLGAWVVGGSAYVALDLGEVGLGIGVLMVAVAALALTIKDEGSIRPILAQALRWRISVRWYAVAVLLPASLVAVALVASSLLGGQGLAPDSPAWTTALFLPLYVLFLGGPEELGWRGYLLPRLQARYTALAAALIVAGIWMAWHVPVLLVPTPLFESLPVGPYLVIGIASSVVYAWLYNSTGGSILMVVLLHGAGNLALAWMNASTVTWWLLASAWTVVAILLVIIYGTTDLARRPRHQVGTTG